LCEAIAIVGLLVKFVDHVGLLRILRLSGTHVALEFFISFIDHAEDFLRLLGSWLHHEGLGFIRNVGVESVIPEQGINCCAV